jgi:hypothetical protein
MLPERRVAGWRITASEEKMTCGLVSQLFKAQMRLRTLMSDGNEYFIIHV